MPGSPWKRMHRPNWSWTPSPTNKRGTVSTRWLTSPSPAHHHYSASHTQTSTLYQPPPSSRAAPCWAAFTLAFSYVWVNSLVWHCSGQTSNSITNTYQWWSGNPKQTPFAKAMYLTLLPHKHQPVPSKHSNNMQLWYHHIAKLDHYSQLANSSL